MWTLFEPVHAVTYFAPEARAAYEEAGLRGYWRGYFAGRAAPLGVTGPEVVTASFFNFAPSMVARAIPGVWGLITPEGALAARRAGAVNVLRRVLAGLETDAAIAAELLWQVASEVDCAGRVLAAANSALPQPDALPSPGGRPSPDGELARLWQAATVLREHRGDGHFAALVAAGVDGCEAVVLRCALDLARENHQPARGWTDQQWDAAAARLAGRGWLDAGERITTAGREAHSGIEQATDLAAAGPWLAIGPAATAELTEVLTPLALACAAELPQPNPLGVPTPNR
jgi:hypothetical protein